MNAQLPIELFENEIVGMMPRDTGWTVPWALHIGEQDELFLNGKYTISERLGGTVQLHIRRDHVGDFHVFLQDMSYKFSRGACYVGGSNSVPVKTFNKPQGKPGDQTKDYMAYRFDLYNAECEAANAKLGAARAKAEAEKCVAASRKRQEALDEFEALPRWQRRGVITLNALRLWWRTWKDQ